MPSFLHQAIVELFRSCPSLTAEFLEHRLGVRLPSHTRVGTREADLGELVPTDHRADLVVVLEREGAVFAVVVEVQLHRDPGKPWVWPLYASALRARYRCPTCLLVITPDATVAAWAARPVDTGQPGCPFRPLVVGPRLIPRVLDPATAREHPELAVLSVQAHGRKRGALGLALAATEALRAVEPERSMLYLDMIFAAVDDAVRRKLEERMLSGKYEFQSEFARRYLAKGREEGREEGVRLGKAEAVLKVIAGRGLPITEAQRRTILQCADLPTLDQWIEQALTAHSAEDLLH